MKRLTLLSLAGIVAAIGIAAEGQGTRSARPVDLPNQEARPGFDPSQSVALFVGARTFSDDATLEMVPYAVDDAVDLAYTFARDPRVGLVDPKHVVLALSDPEPRKPMSQRRLAELRRRGATVVPATQSQILKLLARQAGAAGADGIFIVSFASHGFSHDGAQYLLASNSLFREFHTAIPAARIFDLVAQSRARRSLILIDACRERVQKQRSGPEQLSAAPLIRQMALTEGQVALYAAAAGQFAYDDDVRQNGVFSRAVLEGLQCQAGYDRTGLVTIDVLSAAVERSVVSWIRTNRDPFIRNATQVNIDGAARAMPLAICSRPAPPDPPPAPPMPRPTIHETPGSRAQFRSRLESCRNDGKALLTLYEHQDPNRFVTTYVRWRDGCVAALRDLDERLPESSSETNRFLSIANFWCATKCPDTLSAGNCALFQENPRAERCYWDLDKAMKAIADVVIRNPAVLQTRAPGELP